MQHKSTGRAIEPSAPNLVALDDAAALARVRACVEATLAEVGPGFAHGYLAQLAEEIVRDEEELAALAAASLPESSAFLNLPSAAPALPVEFERRSRFSAGARMRSE